MTYKAVGRSIINYAPPVWSTNLRDTSYRKIKYTQNEALGIATGYHQMSSVDNLHVQAKMLKVREHSELLSAQYLADVWQEMSATPQGKPLKTDEGDTIHQTSQHCRTNDFS